MADLNQDGLLPKTDFDQTARMLDQYRQGETLSPADLFLLLLGLASDERTAHFNLTEAEREDLKEQLDVNLI